MSTHLPAEDRLLAVASAIANGDPVDWHRAQEEADEATTSVLAELRGLAGLSELNDPIPNTWGPFLITGELGEGAYGKVYRALDPTLDLEMALKVIRPLAAGLAFDPHRALAEARLLAQVNHPEVVRVYRAELFDEEVGISMELVKGRTLHDLVRRDGRMDAPAAITIGLAVCRALAAVHGARLIHGDVKANNVMRERDGPRVVLMDFGAGHDLKRAAARAGVGTPLYMAPEVLDGNPPSVASDIYSVGVLLYYLVTGTYPVTGNSDLDVRRRHAQEGARRRLGDLRPDLPEAFVKVVERASAERASDRYSSARALGDALEGALRPAVRWKMAAIAASLATALIVGSLVATDWSWRTPVVEGPTGATAVHFTIEAGLYKDENGSDVRLNDGDRVNPGDRLSMQITASAPLHVFVVSEDDRGQAFLLFPLPGQSLTNPLPPDTRHQLPGMQADGPVYWQVTSAGGREHFVVFASREPQPDLTRYLASLPAPTVGRPVTAEPLSEDALTTLRGIGGLTGRPRVLADLPVATLSGQQEDASGEWVRKLTLRNPGTPP